MVKGALLVRLEAKSREKKADVEKSPARGSGQWCKEEPATTAGLRLRLGPTTFGIFDAFPDEAGPPGSPNGKVAAVLMAQARELFSQPPVIDKVDVLAVQAAR